MTVFMESSDLILMLIYL